MKPVHVLFPLALAATAAITWLASLYVFEQPVFADNVEQHELHSSVLGEDREYLVHLPASYHADEKRTYPVIYVLDGSSQDIHTAESAALLARIDRMPEVIVVGIPNVSGEGRQRDYTPPDMRQDTDASNTAMGGGDRFLAFLRDELRSEVEARYRTSSRRMLAGHSRGGLLVVHALISDPAAFDNYLAHSPALWRDDRHILSALRDFLGSGNGNGKTLFLSIGSDENDKMRGAYDEAVQILTIAAPQTLAWRSYISETANHRENPRFATPVALDWLQQLSSAE